MRLAILLTRAQGKAKFSLAAQGEPAEINRLYKTKLEKPGNLVEIQLWTTSAGLEKRKRFAGQEPEEPAATGAPVVPAEESPVTAQQRELEALDDAQLLEVAVALEVAVPAAGEAIDRAALIKQILAKAN